MIIKIIIYQNNIIKYFQIEKRFKRIFVFNFILSRVVRSCLRCNVKLHDRRRDIENPLWIIHLQSSMNRFVSCRIRSFSTIKLICSCTGCFEFEANESRC